MARMFPGMSYWQYKAIKEREERQETQSRPKQQGHV